MRQTLSANALELSRQSSACMQYAHSHTHIHIPPPPPHTFTHTHRCREEIAWTLQTLSANALELSRLWQTSGFGDMRLVDVEREEFKQQLPMQVCNVCVCVHACVCACMRACLP